MKHVWAAAVITCALMAGAVRAETVLVDQDFSTGHLPKPWTDNTSPGVSAKLERVTDDQTRMTRLTPIKGQVQWTCTLPHQAGQQESYYRLTFTGRSVTRAVLQVGLQPSGGPSHKMAWSAKREIPEITSDQSLSFQLPKQSSPLSLVLTMPPSGSIDLGHITLVQMTRDELIEAMKKEHPKGGTTRNLLRVSCFPMGIQSGGAIGRDRSDEEYEVAGDPAVTGPSGVPALKLKCAQPLRFFLPPTAIPWTFLKHTASVYLRGHGTGSLSVLGDGISLASQPFKVDSNDWTRVTLTFDPTLLTRQHQLALDMTGEIWADAFQLEPGEKATDYTTRPELWLALPETDASVVRIQFDDDPAVVNFMATGVAGNVLNAKVLNIYGEERQLPDVSLVARPGSDIAQGSLAYAIFAGHSFGAYRIEAWLEDQTGRRVSPYAEQVIIRIPRARSWDDDAPDSPFGAHLGPIHRQMVLAKAVGINWARLHDAGVESVGWSYVEPIKGQWHWRDEDIKRYRDHHLSLLGTLEQTPGWASGLGRPATDYWDRYLEPANLADWENYVKTVTSHYKDSIQAWDIWNEPWMKFWSKWDPAKKQIVRSDTAAADYAKLEASSFTSAKSVNPTFTLLGLNSTGGTHGRKWSQELAAADGLGACDAFSYHSYTNETAGFPGDVADRHFHNALDPALAKSHPATAPSTAPSEISNLKSSPSDSSLPDKPVWMTEGSGTNLAITRGFYHYSAPGEDPEDAIDVADRLARYEVSILSQGVSKLFLYHTNVDGEFRPGPGDFQSLVTDDGFPDPSAAAQAVLAWHIEGKKFLKRIELSQGVYASIFTGETHSVAVITSAPSYTRYDLPRDVIAVDVRDLFGNDIPGGAQYNGRTTYVDVQGSETELEKVLHHGGTHRASPSTHPAR